MASPSPTLPRSDRACPNCGADAEPGQLVCLECGSRLALDYRRPTGGRAAAAVVLAVLVGAGAAFAITLAAVDDGAKKEVAATKGAKSAAPAAKRAPAKQTPAKQSASDKSAAKQKTAEQKAAAERAQQARAKRRRDAAARKERQRAAAPTSGGIAGWPKGRNGFMVVLLSTQDSAGARDFAKQRRRDGVDGVLHADDYPSLSSSKGFYIVFAGPYPSRGSAERGAGKLQGRFPGVFVQYVDGAKKR
jgi:septal ring-binding cell division protein DamX